ncbi:MAG TPA: NarK family nitrate/nitrite MFS transporter [Steroidobacter sp.]|jgi:NNP family nitrate/nitrite transporter-like MFS transporter|nr:NarK family nitrate/nitrite MFS transporter [Steroidobacter sp.]
MSTAQSNVAVAPVGGRVLKIWTPEDQAFWEREGKAVANLNLWISIPALFLAFAVWMVWSVVVVNMPNVGFKYTTDQLFWLAAIPSLSGATLRIFYSFLVPMFGGRKWTTISTASLLLPAIGIGFAVQHSDTPYWVMATLAVLCGFGGGNFSSSMANISFFFPKERKGSALGLNAGLGNLGVSAVQFVAPLVITFGLFGGFGGDSQTWVKEGVEKQLWLQNAGFVWAPFIILSTLSAWFFMHDIADAEASFSEQAIIFKRKHTWLMCWLYIGTFGSFIGFSAGLPLLIKWQFPQIDPMKFAFFGPLVGALVRPFGGWLSDRLGGARVTFWTFLGMIAGVASVLSFLPVHGEGGNFNGFLLSFMLLFAFSGIGNGSTFRMIPVIFMTERQRAAAGKGSLAREQATKQANKEAAAVLGFSAAIGAYGGFFIPKSYGTSIALTGGADAALYGFITFYVSCVALTWWWYSRKNAPMPC